MNQRERLIFFELLRSALWEHEVDITVFEGDWIWSNILQAFRKHSLSGIVSDVIMKLPADYLPDEQQQLSLFKYSAKLIIGHQRLNSAIHSSFKLLEEAGCSPILLKGQGLTHLYPKNCIRSYGDVDIYVGPEQMETAKQVFKNIATPEAIKKADEGDVDHEYKIVIDEVIYEIHRYPGGAGNKNRREAFIRLSLDAFNPHNTEQVSLNTLHDSFLISVPSRQVNAWFIFNHLVQHFHVNGVGLRQFCDWMMVLKNEEGSSVWSEELGVGKEEHMKLEALNLSDPLHQLGLTRAWKILSGILVHQLGFPAESMPLYDAKMAQKSQGFILDQIIEGDNFRFGMMPDGHQDSNIFRRVLNSLEVYYKTSRATFVISRSYPIRKFCERVVYGVRRVTQEACGKIINGGARG